MSPSNLPAPLRAGRTRMRNKLPRSMFWQGRLDLTKDPFLSRWPSFSGRGRVPCRWPPPPPITYSSSEPRGLSLLPDFPFWYDMANISSEFRRTPVTVSWCYLGLESPARLFRGMSSLLRYFGEEKFGIKWVWRTWRRRIYNDCYTPLSSVQLSFSVLA